MMTMDRNSDDGAQLSPKPQQIEMFPSGLYVDLINPDPDTIRIEDIAHHLSLTCRYTGGVRRFYSVAEHCVLVAELVKYVELDKQSGARYEGKLSELQRNALMHDAAEAYINDLTAPAKWALRKLTEPLIDDAEYFGKGVRSPYDTLGDNLDTVISQKFDFYTDCPEVRVADLWAMRIEAEALTVSKGANWRWPWEMPYGGKMPGDVNWHGGLSAELAEQMFRRKYQELFNSVLFA